MSQVESFHSFQIWNKSWRVSFSLRRLFVKIMFSFNTVENGLNFVSSGLSILGNRPYDKFRIDTVSTLAI